MKAVYHTEIHFLITLKSGQTIKNHNHHYLTYYHYKYGELPENQTIEYNNPETVFNDLRQALGYNLNYPTDKTLFTKRNYINDYEIGQRIYEDELLSFKVIHKYIPHTKFKTKELFDKLTFEDYTQLVFDREQELQYNILFGKEEP